jgi:hypothetical protein
MDFRQLLSGTLVAALLASAWLAASSQASEIGLGFASQRPGTTTAMTLHIRYTQPGNPNAKPPPIRRIQIDAPSGTAFQSSKVPACSASDAEVMARGAGACPSASKIGEGPIVVVTGFGAPFDPFVSPTPVFNDGRGWLEVSQTPTVPTTIAVTRLTVTGSRISGNIAPTPGGPPDNQTAVSTLDLAFPASTGYVTTPPTCPAGGRWVTTGTFAFADGTTQVVHGDTPCVATTSSGGGGGGTGVAPRARLRGPARCVTRTLQADVTGAPIRRVTYSVDGRAVHTARRADAAGRWRLSRSARHLASGRHVLTARVQFTGAPARTLRRVFRRCCRVSRPARR